VTKIVAITGARAGVGRATAIEFAKNGCDVVLMAREQEGLERAAAEAASYGVRALAIPTDVADAAAVEAAAQRAEDELGPIDIWVNVAFATVFAPLHEITPEEYERATRVTYLGQVHGTMAALKRMRMRDRGTIVNVSSALAYRSVPLQAAYCGAKAAVRGFSDSLRSELLHDKKNIRLTLVDLPGVNTPQFDWALNKMGRKARPVAPVFQPEVAARAIYFAAFNKRREIWVGLPTVMSIVGNQVAPGLLDHYLASAGYKGQLTQEPHPDGAPNNLFTPVAGDYGAHGRFDSEAHDRSWEFFTDRHRDGILAGLVALTAAGIGLAWRNRAARGRTNGGRKAKIRQLARRTLA
jgi:short-subunit dehydrogenase